MLNIVDKEIGKRGNCRIDLINRVQKPLDLKRNNVIRK